MAIKSSFFGLNIVGDSGSTYPVNVPFSTYRFWDNTCRWQLCNPSSGVYSFTNFAFWLNKIRTAGVHDVIYELGGTPQWASSQPSNTGCDNQAGGDGYCAPPTDLNSDGTGANLIWREWCKAVAQYFNTQSDILVSGWCPWNEFTRNSGAGQYAWVGTNAQMLRLSEDARAIILGRGSITATGETVAHALSTVGLTSAAYNSASSSVMQGPSTGVGNSGTHLSVYQAYMAQAPGAIAAAEVLAFHIYGEANGDALLQYNLFTGILTGANIGKTLWLTELGWNTLPGDPNSVVTSWYTALYPLVARIYWYATVDSVDGLQLSSGTLTTAGKAYSNFYNSLTATTTVNNLDDIVPGGKTNPRWKAPCYLPSCNPGGSGRPTYNSQTTGHSTPSLDGASMQFSMTGPPNTNILWVLIAGYNNAATNFTNDFHVWIPTDSKGLVGSYEIDMFLFSSADNVEYMFGTQWNEASGKWQIWDQQHGHWIDTKATVGFTLGNWTHVQQSAHRIAGDTKHMYFDYVIINGTTYWYSGTPGVPVQQPSGPGYTTGECGIQFQVDLWSSGPGGNITYYIDQASFTAAPATGQSTSITDSVVFGENLSTQGNNNNSAYIYDSSSFSDFLIVNGEGTGQVTNVDNQPTIPSPVFNPIVIVGEE
jgi:hypothetical protein